MQWENCSSHFYVREIIRTGFTRHFQLVSPSTVLTLLHRDGLTHQPNKATRSSENVETQQFIETVDPLIKKETKTSLLPNFKLKFKKETVVEQNGEVLNSFTTTSYTDGSW